jgi:hypothetical protein
MKRFSSDVPKILDESTVESLGGDELVSTISMVNPI